MIEEHAGERLLRMFANFDGNAYWSTPLAQTSNAHRAALKGGQTVSLWMRPENLTGNREIVTFGAGGESSATNYLLQLLTTGTEIQYFAEYGSSGTNISAITSGAGLVIGHTYNVALRRRKIDSVYATVDLCVHDYTPKTVRRFSFGSMPLPTGGDDGIWRVGSDAETATKRFIGQITDIALIPEQLSDFEVFNQTGWE